jgi:TRAP-type C4-dicarboxylate transport system permease small subunit
MAESSAQATVLVSCGAPLTPAGALARLVSFCAGVLLVMMTFIVLLGVFYRYALGDPIFWIEEVSRYVFAYIVFLGAALSTHRRGHMAVDALVLARGH